MKHDAYRFNLTPGQMRYLLFGSKRCPRCDVKMKRHSAYRTMKGSQLNTRTDAFYRKDARVKDKYYVFRCENCGYKVSLEQLAQRRNDK